MGSDYKWRIRRGTKRAHCVPLRWSASLCGVEMGIHYHADSFFPRCKNCVRICKANGFRAERDADGA